MKAQKTLQSPKMISFLSSLVLLVLSFFPQPSYAQSTEERFHDLFVTAGYSTAFGAALGAAFLGLADDPAGDLRYIAVGASLGFIGGSALGTYVIFSPIFAENDSYDSGSSSRFLADHDISQSRSLDGLELGYRFLLD